MRMKRYRTTRKPKLRRKRRLIRRVPRYRRPNDQIINVTRRQAAGTWTFSTATFAGFCPGFTFAINALPSFGEFQALYRYYRIRAVSVTFVPKWTNAEITTGGSIPTLYIRKGRDAVLATIGGGTYSQSTLNNYMEAPTKRLYMNRPRTYYIRVNTHNDESPEWNNWYSLQNNVAEPYFGFNAFQHQPGFAVTANAIDIFYKYYMQFKGIK